MKNAIICITAFVIVATMGPYYTSQGGVDLLRYPAAGVLSMATGIPSAQLDIELRAMVDRKKMLGEFVGPIQKAEAGCACALDLESHVRCPGSKAIFGSTEEGRDIACAWIKYHHA